MTLTAVARGRLASITAGLLFLLLPCAVAAQPTPAPGPTAQSPPPPSPPLPQRTHPECQAAAALSQRDVDRRRAFIAEERQRGRDVQTAEADLRWWEGQLKQSQAWAAACEANKRESEERAAAEQQRQGDANAAPSMSVDGGVTDTQRSTGVHVRSRCLGGVRSIEQQIDESSQYIESLRQHGQRIDPIHLAALDSLRQSLVKARASAVDCEKALADQEDAERRSAAQSRADIARWAAEEDEAEAAAKRRAAAARRRAVAAADHGTASTPSSGHRAYRAAMVCLEANGLNMTSQRMTAHDGAVEMISFDIAKLTMLLRLDKRDVVQGGVVLAQTGSNLEMAARVYFSLGSCLTGLDKRQVSQVLLSPQLAKLGGAYFRTVKTSVAKFAIAWTESDVKELAKQ